ncbi:hypothetical protein [Amycolatopsis sp. FBCC-B4732]|nr:hypothetical protein [Amycolatopsis sp. FBCC-B4732]
MRTRSSGKRLIGQIGQALTSPSPSTAGSSATRFAWSATPGG